MSCDEDPRKCAWMSQGKVGGRFSGRLVFQRRSSKSDQGHQKLHSISLVLTLILCAFSLFKEGSIRELPPENMYSDGLQESCLQMFVSTDVSNLNYISHYLA